MRKVKPVRRRRGELSPGAMAFGSVAVMQLARTIGTVKAPPKLHLVVCRCTAFEVTSYRPTAGNAAVTAFYAAVEHQDLVFAALYGTDGGLINNVYRSGARSP